MPDQPATQVNQEPVQFYRADGWFNATKIAKVFTNSIARNKFGGPKGFMEVKRDNPNTPYGSSDKPFLSNGKYGTAVPGLRQDRKSTRLNSSHRT